MRLTHALGLAPLLLAACYRYTPIETSALRGGTDVRVRVTGATADQIEPLLGLPDARVLNGRLVVPGPDTLIVEVPTVLRADVGGSVQTLSQRIAIPRSGLVEAEARTLDRLKTTAVVGGAAVVIGALIVKYTVLDPGKEQTPGGGIPPELRVPIFGRRW